MNATGMNATAMSPVATNFDIIACKPPSVTCIAFGLQSNMILSVPTGTRQNLSKATLYRNLNLSGPVFAVDWLGNLLEVET